MSLQATYRGSWATSLTTREENSLAKNWVLLKQLIAAMQTGFVGICPESAETQRRRCSQPTRWRFELV